MKKSMRKPVSHRRAGLKPIAARMTPDQQRHRALQMAERVGERLVASGLDRSDIAEQPTFSRAVANVVRVIRRTRPTRPRR